jgi:opacity protein-like surface antigen
MAASASQMGWPLPGGDLDLLTGPYFAAGLALQPATHFALFGEYRYTSFDMGFDTTNSPLFPTMNGRVDTSLDTDHFLVGLSYRFPEENGTK